MFFSRSQFQDFKGSEYLKIQGVRVLENISRGQST